MASKIIARVASETGIPRLFPALSEEIALSDLQSLLMHVYQARTANSRESDLRRGAERPLVASSKVDARLLNQFDRIAFQVAQEFEAIELSPVGPLGLNHVLGGIDQNNVLTTMPQNMCNSGRSPCWLYGRLRLIQRTDAGKRMVGVDFLF